MRAGQNNEIENKKIEKTISSLTSITEYQQRHFNSKLKTVGPSLAAAIIRTKNFIYFARDDKGALVEDI